MLNHKDKKITQTIVRLLYLDLQNRCSEDFYKNWHRNFQQIHGVLNTQRKIDKNEINKDYDLSINSTEDVFKFIFCLETYYSLILRLITFKALNNLPVSRDNLKEIVTGNYLKLKKILNYSCPEWFNWFQENGYYDIDLEPLIIAVNGINLENYNSDLIKHLYEDLFSAKIRHSMGEFFTPDWLADYVIQTLIEEDNDACNKTFMDPSCGSGTFIIQILQKFKDKNSIINNVFGVDLNPISALAAKTNILLILREKLKTLKDYYVIPIFNTDIINPTMNEEIFSLFINLPSTNISYDDLKSIYILLKTNSNNNLSLSKEARIIYDLIKEQNLSDQKLDQLLACYAPHCLKDIDYIAGNPPWVNWEYLPADYRKNTEKLWQYYGLFDLKGMDSTFIKEDISALLTYTVIDRHLKMNGSLGFVIKQTLFKSSRHGEGFRKFHLVNNNIPLKVIKVDDLTEIQAFTVSNRSALVFIKKGEKTDYPVPYFIWESNKSKKILDRHEALSRVLQGIKIVQTFASPVDKTNSNSGWINLNPENITNIDKILGSSSYQARIGSFTGGANAIYYLNIVEEKDNLIKVKNITSRAKKKTKEVECWIEKDHVYPLLTGRDIGFWDYNCSQYILLPHTKETKIYPISPEELMNSPKTDQYFNNFKEELTHRKGFAGWENKILQNYFYAAQRVGDYTFEPYKVAWKYISKKFIVSVIENLNDKYLGHKNIIPNDKVVFVGLNDKTEAYYLCGLLSSSLYATTIQGFMVETQIAPYILQKLNVPLFDPENKDHRKISELCEAGHKDRDKNKAIYVEAINKTVLKILDSSYSIK